MARNEKRSERRPMTGFEPKMPKVSTPGFMPRWVNDKPGRLKRFEEAGYKFVLEDELDDATPGIQGEISQPVDTKVSMVVDSETGMKAYLMKQPLPFYNQDQASKAKEIDAKESDMLAGLDSHGAPRDAFVDGRGGRFRPKNTLTVTKGGP